MNKKALLARLEKLIEKAAELLTTAYKEVSLFSAGNKDWQKYLKVVDREFFAKWRISCLAYLETYFKVTSYVESFKSGVQVQDASVQSVKYGLIVLNTLKENLETEVVDKQLEPEADDYVAEDRIEELVSLPKDKFDTAKLVKLCEELNQNYKWKNYFAVGALLRTILHHIPPIFEKKEFKHVASDYDWGKSDKDSIMKLYESAKTIADSLLHKHIRKREALPKKPRVNFRAELDILLAEIVTIIKSQAKDKKTT